MEISFYLPVQNARDYFDKDGVLNEMELDDYMKRFASAVISKAKEYYKERPECEFGYEWDYNTLGGCYWKLLPPDAAYEANIVLFDAMLPVLELAESQV